MMKISVNQIRKINQIYHAAGDPAPQGVDHLVRTIGDQLGAVEEVIPFGDRFEGVIVARIVSCDDHPDADRLHICKLDDGGVAQQVERDDNGHVQVVCGAPNVREGLTVAWLPPGSTVPESIGKEPFVLSARPLRGVVSNGMLASPRELTIGDSHEGIMELDDNLTPGTLFIDAYDLRDGAVIDIENKMFTHRPDCFGALGVAREIAGIYHQPYRSPEWYRIDPEVPGIEAEELLLTVQNDIPELVPRFTAITMRDITLQPSPVWMQIYLTSVGMRPINNIVDYTNFFMLLTGQPLHAYDYDKVKALSDGDAAAIVVRRPREGEQITLLNGKTITPRTEAIMIATDRELIGVGGVMGGGDTEVDENTKNIILECATFDMYSIRRTSMEHGLFTDAVTRFNKGQSPLQNKAVLAKIIDEIRQYAGGKVAGDLIDNNHLPSEVIGRGSLYAPVQLTAAFINERLGLTLSSDEISTLLTNVEFSVERQDETLIVTAPFWRTDVAIPEDIVEEVGRLYGYDHLPLALPRRDLTPAQRNALLEIKQQTRTLLARSGANELLNYSFVHGNLLDKVGQNKADAYRISNAISPDLQYFRMSLTPSLLEKIHPNIKAGYDRFAVFEIGKAHIKGHVITQDDADDSEGLPKEFERLAFVLAADAKAAKQLSGAAYYEAKKYLEVLLRGLKLGDDLRFEPFDDGDSDVAGVYYQPGRSAKVMLNGRPIGRIGEYKVSVRKSLKLPEYCAGFELSMQQLLALVARHPKGSYQTMPKFPAVSQDICLKVATDMPYADLHSYVAEAVNKLSPEQTVYTIKPIDIYQRDDDDAHKQITFRLAIASYERTLTDDEVNAILEQVAEAAANTLHAERI
jgi:phenylalanyl-tRNA synthetase beta chain